MAAGSFYDKTLPFGGLGENQMYEYCVMHSLYPDDPHRWPMSKNDAEMWVAEFGADGGREGTFYVARRKVGPWVKQ